MQVPLSGLSREPSSKLSGGGHSLGQSGELLSTHGGIVGGEVALWHYIIVYIL